MSTPPNHFRYQRLVHPITLPTCAAKFFSGPKNFTEAWLKLCFMAISLAALAASSATWGKGRFFWYRSLSLGLTWDIQKMKDPKSDLYLSSDGKMSLLIFWGKHQKYASKRHKIRHTSTHHLAPMTFSPVSPEKNWSPLLLAETSSRLLVLRPAWLLAVA